MKILNQLSRFFLFKLLILNSFNLLYANEPVDIWNIEKKENKSITEIFKLNGEKYFRDLEEKISIKKLKEYNNVISLGGGAFLNAKIRKQSSLNSITIWLYWKTSTLIDRIKNNKKRPVVTNLKANEIKGLIEERSKVYNSSDYKVNCDKLSKSEIVDKIKDFYENT